MLNRPIIATPIFAFGIFPKTKIGMSKRESPFLHKPIYPDFVEDS